MKIIKVLERTTFSVETEGDNNYNDIYTRYSADSWTVRIGESDEPLYECKNIELLYQEWLKNQQLKDKTMQETFKDIRNDQKRINITNSGENMLFSIIVGELIMQVAVDKQTAEEIQDTLRELLYLL